MHNIIYLRKNQNTKAHLLNMMNGNNSRIILFVVFMRFKLFSSELNLLYI